MHAEQRFIDNVQRAGFECLCRYIAIRGAGKNDDWNARIACEHIANQRQTANARKNGLKKQTAALCAACCTDGLECLRCAKTLDADFCCLEQRTDRVMYGFVWVNNCLLYTSDAADEVSPV